MSPRRGRVDSAHDGETTNKYDRYDDATMAAALGADAAAFIKSGAMPSGGPKLASKFNHKTISPVRSAAANNDFNDTQGNFDLDDQDGDVDFTGNKNSIPVPVVFKTVTYDIKKPKKDTQQQKSIFGVEDIDLSAKPRKGQLPPLAGRSNDLFSVPAEGAANDDLDMRELKAYLKV